MATVNNNDAINALIAQVTALAATVIEIQASNETKMDALQATVEASANKAMAAAYAAILAATKDPADNNAAPAADKANSRCRQGRSRRHQDITSSSGQHLNQFTSD